MSNPLSRLRRQLPRKGGALFTSPLAGEVARAAGRRGSILLCALSLLLSLTACAPKIEPHATTIFAMDTVMNLTVYGEKEALDRAVEDIYHMERQFSATVEDSLVARLNRGETVSPSLVLQELLDQSLALCERTGGALDLTAYPATQAWGFSTGEYRVPGDEELECLADGIDYTQIKLIYGENGRCELTLPAGTQMDLGAVAKGYAGDTLAGDLRNAGVTSALLDLGQSSIQAVGAKPDGSPWRIGIQDPHGESYLGVLELNDQAMGTSGSYQRYFEQDGVRYCHIIDPATAQSGLASVTVVSDSCLACDGLSTALFVMGLEEAGEYWRENRDFEAIFIEENGNITITAGMQADFRLQVDQQHREVTVLE